MFVREHTSICVPLVHLVFKQNGCMYIVMQHIDAPTLEQQWDNLDEDMRATSASQSGEALRQLLALENPTSRPRPLNNTKCCGPWFAMYDAGPFENHSSLVHWLNHKIEATAKHAEKFTENYRLVFTHQDLALRNLMLDKKAQLWIIDWELAGWYPAYFEYACVASMVPTVPD
ncbi:kinase-like domain-containing protein [Collybia nuda]|uniref:Kinase-like domain-containing protein n=1 Tax=Collybia nuda TaxID=64659 RepID=A0A9P6CLC7_9AGAR|nr:kinase-like domain-containing protein [Collybia nuda]